MTDGHRLFAERAPSSALVCGLMTVVCIAYLRFGICRAVANPVDAPTRATLSQSPTIELAVDARDVRHRIIGVHETIPISGAAPEVVLLYPKWIPGDHAPDGPIGRLAGIGIQADGVSVAWYREAANVFAFHVPVPPGTNRLDVTFQYLAPSANVRDGALITRNIIAVKWPYLLLYEAGHPPESLQVHAQVRLPEGYSWTTSLLPEAPVEGATDQIAFVTVPLDVLVDSPLYAGIFTRQFALDAAISQPINLTLFGERAEQVAMTSEQLAWHRSLVREADALFGSRPFAHYDMMVTLSASFGIDGLEHRQSSEIFLHPDYVRDWGATWDSRYLVAHEFVHAWNGKWRVPAGLHVQDLNTDPRLDLLWIYEGQTQYWAKVLSTRCGIWSARELLDDLAVVASQYASLPARSWRTLLDSTLDPVANPRGENEWRSWQRFQDYYDEGSLIWLDVDTLLRTRTQGRRSLDDFARVFFAGGSDPTQSKSYDLTDVIAALRGILPYDWETFFLERTAQIGHWNPLDGIHRAGYKLVFNDQPGPTCTAESARRGLHCFTNSVGLTVSGDGMIESVEWNSAAFRAGLSAGMKLISINGLAFSPELLLSAIVAEQSSSTAIEIVAQDQDHVDTLSLAYHDGPRYPHLVRDEGSRDWFAAILQPRSGHPK